MRHEPTARAKGYGRTSLKVKPGGDMKLMRSGRLIDTDLILVCPLDMRHRFSILRPILDSFAIGPLYSVRPLTEKSPSG